MTWELWGLHPGNRIAKLATRAEALAMVRAFVDDGWLYSDLAIGCHGDDAQALTGDALARAVEEEG